LRGPSLCASMMCVSVVPPSPIAPQDRVRPPAMNLFGRKKAPDAPQPAAPTTNQPPDNKAAITKVRDTLETITKREEHLHRKIDNEVKNAKQFSTQGKKREALQCIKRKKMIEKQLDQLGNTKFTLETQQAQLEQMNMNQEALGAQREAARTMQRQMQSMGGVDAVEETMDQVEDGLADANEIAEALGRSVAMPGMEDEDELLAELEGLEADGLADELGAVELEAPAMPAMPSAPISFPSAPSAPAKKQMTDEERELAELEQSMAM